MKRNCTIHGNERNGMAPSTTLNDWRWNGMTCFYYMCERDTERRGTHKFTWSQVHTESGVGDTAIIHYGYNKIQIKYPCWSASFPSMFISSFHLENCLWSDFLRKNTIASFSTISYLFVWLCLCVCKCLWVEECECGAQKSRCIGFALWNFFFRTSSFHVALVRLLFLSDRGNTNSNRSSTSNSNSNSTFV